MLKLVYRRQQLATEYDFKTHAPVVDLRLTGNKSLGPKLGQGAMLL